MLVQFTQDHIDYRDLRIGRLTLNLESVMATIEQAKAMLTERDGQLKTKDEEIEQLKARILELEEIVAHLADDEDDESEDDEGSDNDE